MELWLARIRKSSPCELRETWRIKQRRKIFLGGSERYIECVQVWCHLCNGHVQVEVSRAQRNTSSNKLFAGESATARHVLELCCDLSDKQSTVTRLALTHPLLFVTHEQRADSTRANRCVGLEATMLRSSV